MMTIYPVNSKIRDYLKQCTMKFANTCNNETRITTIDNNKHFSFYFFIGLNIGFLVRSFLIK
jgi:hypothetical protein